MKSFIDYLQKGRKTYAFKLKFAGDYDIHSELKTIMDKFKIVELSQGRRTPVQENPTDFPNVKNTNVTIFDLVVEYPSTPQVIESYISERLSINMAHICVCTDNQDAKQYVTTVEEGPLLKSDYPASDNQHIVGQKRVSDFLKNLQTGDYGGHKGESSEMLEHPNTKSPIGSK